MLSLLELKIKIILYLSVMKATIYYTINDTSSSVEFEGCNKDFNSFMRSLDKLEGCTVTKVIDPSLKGLPI